MRKYLNNLFNVQNYNLLFSSFILKNFYVNFHSYVQLFYRIVVGSVNPAPISSADAAKPSVGIGGVTPVDGPAPSILGSIDNIFQSVKEYDQYQCLERML